MERPAGKAPFKRDQPALLVVEDNLELREYLQLLLGEKYQVHTAENGRAALERLRRLPECRLVISDLMMPVMDGYRLLEQLKADEATRYLPVIMLTARAEARDRLKALRIGVDDYLVKPFEEEELLVRIDNLLKNLARRLEESDDGAEPAAAPSPVSESDRKWLEAFEAYVRQSLGDDTLSIPGLARRFAMSESSLLRQLKRLTGLPTKRYLQEMRLDAARRMLEDQPAAGVAKVAKAVGYGDVRSFSRSFKKRFGKSPSEFQCSE